MKTLRLLGYVCALTACGGSTEADTFDGNEVGTVADSASVDTGATSVDTTPVEGESGAVDTGTVTTSDSAAPDTAAPATDTGAPPSGEAGKINCGPTLKCTVPQICCIGFAGGASYKCEATMCSGLSAAAKCDGPEDCSGGQRCCSGFPSGASCKATCGSSDQDMCHADSDCTGGKTCKECTTPGGGPAMRFCVAGGKCPF